MAKIEPFELFSDRYEAWFEKNRYVYLSELEAVRHFIPQNSRGIEIGSGSGRFTAPLKINIGIEPSQEMRTFSIKRGVITVAGVAEALPFPRSRFDYALMVTTICFLDNIQIALNEVYRVLKPHGSLIIGLVDKNSKIGRFYRKRKHKSVFYQNATFYSTEEVIHDLTDTGFKNFQFVQTLFKSLENVQLVEPFKKGYGDGSFVVIRAVKQSFKRRNS